MKQLIYCTINNDRHDDFIQVLIVLNAAETTQHLCQQ